MCRVGRAGQTVGIRASVLEDRAQGHNSTPWKGQHLMYLVELNRRRKKSKRRRGSRNLIMMGSEATKKKKECCHGEQSIQVRRRLVGLGVDTEARAQTAS